MSLTKADIRESVSLRCGLSKTTSTKLVESTLEIIKRTLASGEDVLISGFGKFCVREKKKRRLTNPNTGDDLLLGAKRIVTFRYSPVLRGKIDRGRKNKTQVKISGGKRR
ncbi:MAG: integration host factor subunit alpha [Deltaproteobacteria bacterium]|nr:integration host factor subunit alpha [Deltaproteobacteria bacterium]